MKFSDDSLRNVRHFDDMNDFLKFCEDLIIQDFESHNSPLKIGTQIISKNFEKTRGKNLI